MKKNQCGFGTIEVVLILIIVGAIAGIGWFVWDSNQKTNESLNNADNNQVATKIASKSSGSTKDAEKSTSPVDETANWLSFSPKSKLYTVKLPDGWEFFHQNDECDCLLTKTDVSKAGVLAKVSTIQGGRDGGKGLFIVSEDSDKSSERFSKYTKAGSVTTASGLSGNKYTSEQTSEPDGIGLKKGSKYIDYYFSKNNKWILVSYSFEPGDTDNSALIEKLVKTLQ